MHIPQIATANAHYGLRLEWEPSLAPDFSHYTIHMSSSVDTEYKEIGETIEPAFSLLNIPPATYHFIIYVHDTNGNTSDPSNEVTFTVL